MKNILVGLPTANGYIRAETTESLMKMTVPKDYKVLPYIVNESLVYDARDNIVKKSIESKQVDYILFVDSDIAFDKTALQNMIDDDKDIVTGLYPYKDEQCLPIVRDLDGNSITELPTEPLFEIGRCGMGMCLIKMQVLETVMQACDTCFAPMLNLGEDYSFCARAHGLGFKIYADSEVKCEHIGYKKFKLSI